MRYSQWTTGPFTPRLPIISLPAESPRPASANPDRHSSSQAWATSTFASHRPIPIPTAPAPSFERNYESPRAPAAFPSHGQNPASTAPVRGFDRNYQYQRAPATPSFSSSRREAIAACVPESERRRQRIPSGAPEASTSHHIPAERTRSMTPVPAAPLKSILKSSRTRSLSISSTPEASRSRQSAAQAEPRRSSLSKPTTVIVHTTKPLKPESISLSWPLVSFGSRRRSSSPLFYFDIGFDPSQRTNLRDNRSSQMAPVSTADRNLPVSTHCTITEMIIECPHVGNLIIRQSTGVLCIDVFKAIYVAYQVPLERGELPEDIGRYTEHFRTRCGDCPNPAAERRAGMRRVDLLCGKRIFDGLTRSGANWKLSMYA